VTETGYGIPSTLRGLVFDLDGTLVDSYGAITDALNRTRAAFDLPAFSQEEVRRMVGHGLESLMEEVLGPEHVEAGVALFRSRYAEIATAATLTLPAVPETLRELRRRGYRMAVASNKPARFSSAILDALGLGCFLDTVEGPDTAGIPKPHPRMIGRCLETMGLGSDEAVYVGDMVLDVESGEAAGLAVLLVPGGSSPEADLRATGRPVLASFDDLLQVLPVAVAERPPRSPSGPH
jgi:phosphoglycolate phosphatase